MVDRTYRRTVLQAVGVGLTVGVAGCSGSGDGNDGTTDSGERTETTGQQTQRESTATQTPSANQDDPVGEDVQYDGENTIETLTSENNGLWLELEHTSEQIEYPLEFSYLQEIAPSLQEEVFSNESRETLRLDALYIILEPQSDGSYELAYQALNAEAWDDSKNLSGNWGSAVLGGSSGGSFSSQDLETMFSEDITGYDDVSEDFPQEYLNLIEG